MGLIDKLFGKKVEASSNHSFVQNNIEKVLNVSIAYNKYGGYCTPISTQHRTLNQKILKGDVFEPDTIEFMISNAKEGDVVHAGTFFGDFLPAISKNLNKKSKIWAFEPNPESYRCAQITMIINAIDNVELLQAGLGEKTSSTKILTQNKKGISLGGSSTIVDNQDNKGKVEEIKLFAIDDVIPKNRNISILQLDIEGYEQQALMGALETIKRCRPILILEDDTNFTKSSWFKEHILSLDYSITGKLHYNTVISPN
jgi:FkbM family methyltransferase